MWNFPLGLIGALETRAPNCELMHPLISNRKIYSQRELRKYTNKTIVQWSEWWKNFRIFMEDKKTRNTAMNRLIDGIPHAIRNSWARMVSNCFTISYRKLICVHAQFITKQSVNLLCIVFWERLRHARFVQFHRYIGFLTIYIVCKRDRHWERERERELSTITRTETVLFTCVCIWDVWNWSNETTKMDVVFIPFAICHHRCWLNRCER